MKNLSIVILSYNNWKYTEKCINSILKNTSGDFEIVLVDNASNQETIKNLERFSSNPKIKLIFNNENYGFGKGNNIGLVASSGEYIILLNNDTIVTSGWAETLIHHVKNPKIGLVGPVTNSIGNEAKVDIRYDPEDLRDLEEKSAEYTTKHKGQYLEVENIAAFCWIMKRKTYEQIKGFDERFGKAFFEDDDYCLRVRKAGLKILITEDVFVHHFHSASIGPLDNPKTKQLFLDNKEKFEAKWGIKWIPHRLRDSEYLKQLNILRLQVKELRRQLGIDDDSLLFILKNVLTSNDREAARPEMVEGDKKAELDRLTAYLNRLRKLRKILYFIPWLTSAVDHVRFNFAQSETRQSIRQIRNMKNKIIVFGAIPYRGRYQRPQHLSEELAKRGWGIVYVEMRRSSFPSLSVKKTGKNIYNALISSTGNPNTVMELPSQKNKEEISQLLEKLPLEGQTVFKLDHPFWSFMAGNDKYPVIYDCMDDHDSFEAGNAGFTVLEKELASKCSFVTVSSKSLGEKMKKYDADNVLLLKNAGEYDHFAKALTDLPMPGDMKNLKGRIIGYYGAIAEWFDEKIILKLAETYPNESIVLIGYVSHPTLKVKAKAFSNIRFLGEKPYTKLPDYLRHFDVCLIPFVLNNLIKATNPVKIYEYFTAGKPVVSTDLPELQGYRHVMYLARSIDEFAANVDLALKENCQELAHKRQQIAKNNTWEKRGEVLNHAIGSLFHTA